MLQEVRQDASLFCHQLLVSVDETVLGVFLEVVVLEECARLQDDILAFFAILFKQGFEMISDLVDYLERFPFCLIC